MDSQRKSKPVPRISNGKLAVIIALFFSFILALPAGFYFTMQKQVQIEVDGTTLEIKTFAKSVEDVLAEAGIEYRPEDKIEPELEAEIDKEATIIVERAFPVMLTVEDTRLDIYTTGVKVEEILAQAKVQLNPQDKVEPSLEAIVKPGMEIAVVRVKEEIITNEITLDYQTEKQADKNMTEGQRKIVQQGEAGIGQKIIKVTYEDGKEVKREVIEEKVVRKPVQHIIAYGTKPKVQTVSRGGQNLSYTKALTMQATAYTHTGNRTATGTWPKVGTIAVDTNIIPFGTKLYVEGYGFGVAADRGGAIIGNKIDLFFESHSDAVRWGRKNVKVYILK